jgi:hypothetical protein
MESGNFASLQNRSPCVLIRMAEQHRFPPPWAVQQNEDAFWIQDAAGPRFAYCYFRDVQTVGAGRSYLTRDAARLAERHIR